MVDMLDKWGQFVSVLLPWFTNGNFPVQSLQACLQSFLGSMLSSKLSIESNVAASGSTNLVIFETACGNDEQKRVLMPIQFNSLDSLLENDMDSLNCSIGMTIGKSIRLFYKSQDLHKILCIYEIALDSTDLQGKKLFQLLTNDEFNSDEVMSFFEGLYRQINPQLLLSEILKPFFTNPNIAFKTLLIDKISSMGFEAEQIESSLKDMTVMLSYKGEIIPKKEKDNSQKTTTNSLDTTKFSIDGKTFHNKRNFVLNVVKQFVQDHPGITYKDLENIFPSETISKERGIVRPLSMINEWLQTKPDLKKRYCLRDGEIITLSNGEEIAVYNQWGTTTFPKFLALAEKYYTIKSNKKYAYYTFTKDSNIVSESTDAEDNYSKKGINVSIESLDKFKNKYNK